MKNNELISIIVPIYNTANYLNECIDSILKQTYGKFELILINDGSTDNTRQIVNKYLAKDKRIKFFNRKNFGVSETRNFGISKATGKYIVFIDSDDTISELYLQELISHISDSYIPVCEFKKCYKNTSCIEEIKTKTKKLKYDNLEVPGIEGYIFNKIYVTKIIKDNNIKFDTQAYVQEDTLFNYNYVKHVQNFKIINKPLYNYRMRKSSAVRGQEDIETLLKIEKFRKKEKISTQKIEYDIIRAYIINGRTGEEYRKRLTKYLKNHHFPLKTKIKLIIRRIFKINKITKHKLFE